ncbi:MAG: flavin-containing monooxygenase [Acidimicrobiales bacterium]
MTAVVADAPALPLAGGAAHHRVVIVGAGASGLATAKALSDAGIDDYVLVEKGDEVGGTWRDNTYPGCGCDVPSVWYSFSFAPNPFWSRFYSRQEEILDYLRATSWRLGVRSRIHFGTEVLEVSWRPTLHHWDVVTTCGTLSADVVVLGAGPLHEPRLPDVEGLGSFTGRVFHSARWDHDHDLSGQRVAVIGTGASAIQFIPRIQPHVGELHLFQRTAPWVLPKVDFKVPWAAQQLFHRVPPTEGAVRTGVSMVHAAAGVAFRDARLMRLVQPLARQVLHHQVRDRSLRAVVNPQGVLGCKRVLLSNSYYRALAAPNVSVHPTALTGVDGGAVNGEDGTRVEVDALIFATGFDVARPPIVDRVRDGDGVSLAGHWAAGPTAYLGTAMVGFPNLFMLLGPNIVPGHASVLTTVEVQARYIADAVTTMADHGWAALEVRPDVARALNREVQSALAGTVYNSGCSSYYLSDGRNIANWPWSLARLHRRFRFDVADYVVQDHLTTDQEGRS